MKLRSELVLLANWLKNTVRPSLPNRQLPLGYIQMDSASIQGVPDGRRVGKVLGIPVFRLASLANDKYVYKNLAGTTIANN